LPSKPIAVVGAAGHTGRFVVEELLRRNLEPMQITRDRADLNDPRSLDAALTGAGAVINCAGPFLDTAEQVIEAALRAKIHYFDVTAEQASARATLDTYDARARAAGIAVVPAAGFYGGLGDLLATAALGNWTSADELTIFIALDHWWPTEGTRKTGARNTVRRVVLRAGSLAPQEQPRRTTTWNFGEPFGTQDVAEVPLTEVVLISRHLAVSNATNYISQQPLNELNDSTTPPPTRDDARGRSRQQFLVEAVARRGADERRAVARGQDIYAVTAPLVVEAAERIVANGSEHCGALALGGAFDAREFLAALARSFGSLEVRLPG
jgi:hypothetical protein